MKADNIDNYNKIQHSASLRKTILDVIYRSKASHIGSSFSVVDILSAVYRSVDIQKIKDHKDDRDRVVLSKGHSAAALYVVLNHFGLLSDEELNTYYMNGSILSGHASHFVPYVEHSTGALGHGLSVAAGICIGLKSKGFLNTRVYAILGDGELQEGSNWEAILLSGHLRLNNLRMLIDNNCLGGTHDINSYCSFNPIKSKLESFGFLTFEIDGHDEERIFLLLKEMANADTPVAIVCHTVKGKGVSFMENNNAWHYRPPSKEEYDNAMSELSGGDK